MAVQVWVDAQDHLRHCNYLAAVCAVRLARSGRLPGPGRTYPLLQSVPRRLGRVVQEVSYYVPVHRPVRLPPGGHHGVLHCYRGHYAVSLFGLGPHDV